MCGEQGCVAVYSVCVCVCGSKGVCSVCAGSGENMPQTWNGLDPTDPADVRPSSQIQEKRRQAPRARVRSKQQNATPRTCYARSIRHAGRSDTRVMRAACASPRMFAIQRICMRAAYARNVSRRKEAVEGKVLCEMAW